MASGFQHSQGLSCTVIWLPRAWTRVSRSGGEKPRNWIIARCPRIAATCVDDSLTKIAR